MKVRDTIGALLMTVAAIAAVPATSAGAWQRKPSVVGKAAGVKGNPGEFFGGDSYPPAAIRAGEQGRVVARLEIGVDGRVKECSVAESSGSASLDAKTCEIALGRITFTPALDESGSPIASSYTLPVRWVLPRDVPDTPTEITTATSTDVVNEMAVTIDGKGVVVRCVLTEATTLPDIDPCKRFPVGERITGGATRNGKPVGARIVTRYSQQTTYEP